MSGSGSHPLARQGQDLLRSGRMRRRQFLRLASLLGISLGAASVMAGAPRSAEAANAKLPFPPDDPKAKSGGILRAAMPVGEVDDPAKFESVEQANQVRHMVETLAVTGPDNVTRPMLAERWSASGDLRTWDLAIRQGVLWHNGEELIADHVVWNVRRWLASDPGAGAVMDLSTFAALLAGGGPGAVEAVDQFTVRFRFAMPVLTVMEDLSHYATAICHPSFAGRLTENPIGTGAYKLAEHFVGDICLLKRVMETDAGDPFEYWGGEVYLDEIHYYDPGSDDGLATYASGDVDFVHQIEREQVAEARELEATIHSGRTSRTLVGRMQVDRMPFTDIRVREALVRAVDNAALKAKILPNEGDVAENHLVAPIQRDFEKQPPLERDVKKAVKLLDRAGFSKGIDLTLLVSDAENGWHKALADAMAEQMKEAGIRLDVEMVPAAEFGEKARTAPFAIGTWPHFTLGTQSLSKSYAKGGPLMDAHFESEAFEAALGTTESTLDIGKRRLRMNKVLRILQKNFLMIQPLFVPVYAISSNKVRGFSAHPTFLHQFNKVWLA